MNTQTDTRSLELVQGMRKTIHEFNNTLTPILANAQLARAMIDPGAKDVREAVDDIVEAAGRARELVQEMRQAARDLQEQVDPDPRSGGGEGGSHRG